MLEGLRVIEAANSNEERFIQTWMGLITAGNNLTATSDRPTPGKICLDWVDLSPHQGSDEGTQSGATRDETHPSENKN